MPGPSQQVFESPSGLLHQDGSPQSEDAAGGEGYTFFFHVNGEILQCPERYVAELVPVLIQQQRPLMLVSTQTLRFARWDWGAP